MQPTTNRRHSSITVESAFYNASPWLKQTDVQLRDQIPSFQPFTFNEQIRDSRFSNKSKFYSKNQLSFSKLHIILTTVTGITEDMETQLPTSCNKTCFQSPSKSKENHTEIQCEASPTFNVKCPRIHTKVTEITELMDPSHDRGKFVT